MEICYNHREIWAREGSTVTPIGYGTPADIAEVLRELRDQFPIVEESAPPPGMPSGGLLRLFPDLHTIGGSRIYGVTAFYSLAEVRGDKCTLRGGLLHSNKALRAPVTRVVRLLEAGATVAAEGWCPAFRDQDGTPARAGRALLAACSL